MEGQLVHVQTQALQQTAGVLNQEQMETLKATLCKDLTEPEFNLFAQVCRHKGLDPFSGQIHAIKRGKGQYAKMSIQTGIDGFRLQAERTGLVDGQDPPQWCGPDGVWVDIWLQPTPPAAARVKVYKKGVSRPYVGLARWDSYAQYKEEWQNGEKTGRQSLNEIWQKRGPEQLAKCAESMALRMAYPVELSGLYTAEEMGQADNPAPELRPVPEVVQTLPAPFDPATSVVRGGSKDGVAWRDLEPAYLSLLASESTSEATRNKAQATLMWLEDQRRDTLEAESQANVATITQIHPPAQQTETSSRRRVANL